MNTVQNIDRNAYASSGLEAFETALEQAQSVLDSPESQEAVDTVATNLNAAWIGLRLKAGESLLQQLNQNLEALEAMDLSVFSAPLQTRARTLMANVSAYLSAPEQEKAEGEILLAELQEVRKEMEAQKPEEIQKPASDPTDGAVSEEKKAEDLKTPAEAESVQKSVKTSVFAGAGAFLSAGLAAAGVLLEGFRRKNKK